MLSEFVATKENINRIINYVGHWRLSAYSSVDEKDLVDILLAQTTVIANIEGADGIIILEDIRKGYNGHAAGVSFLFWDRIIRTKIESMQSALEEAMQLFDIGRMTAMVPERNFQLGICYLKIGFLREGRMRRALLDGQDCLIYGLLRSDLEAKHARVVADAERSAVRVSGPESDIRDGPADEYPSGDSTGVTGIRGLD